MTKVTAFAIFFLFSYILHRNEECLKISSLSSLTINTTHRVARALALCNLAEVTTWTRPRFRKLLRLVMEGSRE